jgi:hypothetical protein
MNIPEPQFAIHQRVWFTPWTVSQKERLGERVQVVIEGRYFYLDNRKGGCWVWSYSTTNAPSEGLPRLIPEQYLDEIES